MRKKEPVRRLLVLILITSGLSFLILFIATNNLRKRVAEQTISTEQTNMIREWNEYFGPVEKTISLIQSWGSSGLFYQREMENIVAKIAPVLDQTPQIYSMSVLVSDGSEAHFVRNKQTWRSIVFDSGTDSIAFIQTWSKNYKLLETKDSLNSHRMYFSEEFKEIEQEINDSAVQWMPAKPLHWSNIVGRRAIIKARAFDAGKEYYIAMNTSLTGIIAMIDSIPTVHEGRTMVFTSEGKVFSNEKINEPGFNPLSMESYLVSIPEIQDRVVSDALALWNNHKSDTFLIKRYSSAGEKYWVALENNTRNNTDLWTGVIIPEKEFSEMLTGTRGLVFGAISILFLAALISIIILRKESDQNKSLIKSKDPSVIAKTVVELIAKGESKRLEFKSSVRFNLKSQQFGKEIELAWLKSIVAFLNSEGGQLMLGVSDDGEILGLDKDRFPNDDKTRLHIANLIKQHIGLEFAIYINVHIVEVDLKKIVLIECEPCTQPVFLKQNDKEQFFIRTGPSSVELSMSKVLKYIEDRQKK